MLEWWRNCALHWDGIPSSLLSNSKKTESIFAEINFRKWKWLICTSYNPHKKNVSNHLHHLSKGPDNYNNDDVLLLGDVNSEFPEPWLSYFCGIYNLKNLAKELTCQKNSDNPSVSYKTRNQPKSAKTIQNHPQPAKTSQNQPKPTKNTQNHPQLAKTTHNSLNCLKRTKGTHYPNSSQTRSISKVLYWSM